MLFSPSGIEGVAMTAVAYDQDACSDCDSANEN